MLGHFFSMHTAAMENQLSFARSVFTSIRVIDITPFSKSKVVSVNLFIEIFTVSCKNILNLFDKELLVPLLEISIFGPVIV